MCVPACVCARMCLYVGREGGGGGGIVTGLVVWVGGSLCACICALENLCVQIQIHSNLTITNPYITNFPT